jgi:glucosamine 6-phosphate synthetase-like amidotransferase/phosphosugar isomerase protein
VTLKALQMCKKSGAFCALVAAQGISPDPIADLYLPTSEIEKCEPHTFGMTSSVCAVTSLLLGGAILERWQFLASQHDPDLKILRAQVQSPPTVVLGEREGEWIARETALKLVEMAGVRALVFGSEEYFHGPQLFVQQSKIQEKVWYTGSLSDSRQNDISRMSIQYQAKWDESEPLSWVDCLIHFQWATLALALNLGVNPDTGI